MKINEKVKKFLIGSVRTAGVCSLLFGIAMLTAGSYLYYRFGNAHTFTPPASRQIAAEKTDFSVAFFGDFGMQSRVFIPILQQISAEKPDFAVSVGDMFRKENGNEGPYLTEMLHDHLTVPLCAIPGNHDCYDEHNLTNYCRYFGNPYYFFSFGDTLFIMLDNHIPIRQTPEIHKMLPPDVAAIKISDGLGLPDEQLNWLESVLTRYRKDFRRCVLVMHVPPVSPKEFYDYSIDIIIGYQLVGLVKKFPIDAIVAGHLHTSAKSDFHGIPVYHVSSSGQKNRDKIHPYFGYLTLHFTDSGAIEATPHYLPGLKRGRNYFLQYLVNEIPGNRRYCGFALFLIAAGIGLLATARKLS